MGLVDLGVAIYISALMIILMILCGIGYMKNYRGEIDE